MSYRFVEPLTRVGDGITAFGGAKLSFFDFGTTNPKTTFSDFALTIANTDPVVADSNGLFGDIFLDIKASVTLKSSTDVVIYGPVDIFAPEDSIASLAASLVSVLDTAGNFAATNVETVLAEISDDFLKLSRPNTITAAQTLLDFLQMSDNEIRRPLLLDYAISHNVISDIAGILSIDLSTGNSFVTTLVRNVTVQINNPPATGRYGEFALRIIQDSAGGAFTVTWPASVKWPAGIAPVITVTNGAIDEITLRTIDAGSEYIGSFSQAFA